MHSYTTTLHTRLSHTQFFDAHALSHACLGHTALLHPLLSHTTLSPTTFSHARLFTHHFYTELFHTPHFDTHFLHTPILHHLFSLSCLSHPIFNHFHVSLATYWKKLTCGDIRSFNSSSHPWLLFLRQDKILDAKLRLDNTAMNTAIACIPRWEIATEVLLSMSGSALDGKWWNMLKEGLGGKHWKTDMTWLTLVHGDPWNTLWNRTCCESFDVFRHIFCLHCLCMRFIN